MSSFRPRILIADDHTFVAEMCKCLLEPEFDIAGIVGDGRAMVRAASELKPDLILVDVTMPILNGLEAGERVKKISPSIKLVYLTMNPDPEIAAEAFRRGASGYLLKTCLSSELMTGLRQVLRGQSYVCKSLPKERINYLRARGTEMVAESAKLTERQREVLQLLAEGKKMKEIADALNMAIRTVAFHKYGIMEKVGVKTNAELVRYAVRNHFIPT
jgi:DNA-binding NarL/FixJ family response regulator